MTANSESGEEADNGAVKLSVLTFVNAYLPGYKSGGPIQTIAGMVDQLAGEIDFRIFTADRDAGDSEPYASVEAERWQLHDGATVYYAPPRAQSLGSIRRVVESAGCDVLYLNSFFHRVFTLRPLLLRRLALVRRLPTVIAPRGELSAGALSLKPIRKRVFIAVARALGLYRDVVWHASVEAEAEEVRRLFGKRARVVVAADLRPGRSLENQADGRRRKSPGSLRIAFLSRVSPKKNVLGAIEALVKVTGDVIFDVYGPVSRSDDRAYWERCLCAIEHLPDHVTVTHRGVVPHPEVRGVLARYDLFLLPTRGENFGHAIVDAMEAGCPVLLSDRTPWRNLTAVRAGWDVPLDDTEAFRRAIQKVADMDHGEWLEWSDGARAYGRRHANSNESIEQNRALFRQALHAANW